ncbi:hypothetical protein [Streptomyces sp. NPDC058202]|uniref:hypothetical protein n=1 Tax=Streptomyces sp. NPDC058202 TaxID=3346380 RepID=UPI0036ED3330
MSDTNVTIRDTPAQVADAVLDAIEANPAAFDMATWFWPRGPRRTLLPEQTPECGTTMCIAGWAAHLTGWTLLSDGLSGSRDGVTEDVADIAAEALGLTMHNIFYDSADEAIECLREIAGR